jgi:hypothetical protein
MVFTDQVIYQSSIKIPFRLNITKASLFNINRKMSPKITIRENYILVEPKDGIDLREIQQGVARLFYVEGIPEQNRIWVFREGPQTLSYDDLPKLRDVIKENYPEDVSINKTAIVVESESQSSMAEAFTKIAEDLPQQFKVFSNLADAEAWVKK